MTTIESHPDAKTPSLVCEVCEKNEAIGVACVPGLPISAAYCQECLNANAHPVELLICNTALCGGYDELILWWQEMIDDTLKHLNKTRAWFDERVERVKITMKSISNDND